MDQKTGGQSSAAKRRETAAEIARNRVLAAYNSTRIRTAKNLGETARNTATGTYKQTTISPNTPKNNVNSEDWKKYHSAWQQYYQKYYNDYYSKAAKNYVENEKVKTNQVIANEKAKSSRAIAEEKAKSSRAIAEEKAKAHQQTQSQPQSLPDPEDENIIRDLRKTIHKHARIEAKKVRRSRRFIPILAGIIAVLLILFAQYNRLIFAPIMAYVSPGNTEDTGITALDPTVATAVGDDSRLMIPKINVDVPVNFGIPNDTNSVNAAMENGVAQFAIPGANAMPGEIGNLVITGHSAGDIYSNNQYKFIFSGLERLNSGDLIYIDYQGVRYTYSVTKMETVEPDNVAALVYETNKPMLTLITCTPLGTSRYRLLVTAEQINPAPSGATQQEHTEDVGNSSESAMPQNEPTFFERIWNWLTGNNG